MSYLFKTTLFLYCIFSLSNTQGFTIQEEGFGKNIVQYNEFNWHYIQTEHFEITKNSPIGQMDCHHFA